MDFYEVVDRVSTLLQQRGKLTYRSLKRQFDLDDETLEDLREEILYAQPQVVDDEGKGLIWTGERAITEADQLANAEAPPPEPSIPDAERRQLTVMFCDLADSTRLSGELDPEDLRDVIRAYQSTSAEVIERYDGYIAQHLGDGLMIYFGWPQAHEDDAHRAVYTGLGILETMRQLNSRLEQEKGIRLAVRIGIHTGLVVVGEIGQGASQEHLALGETPNVASRIQGIAASDTVVISDVTYQIVQGYFVCEEMGYHRLKGVSNKQQAYRVVQESDGQSRFDIAATRGLTPLVGRESETTLLRERWEQVKEGHGQGILLSGEAGIGKSRLLQVLRDHVAKEPHTRLECRSSPYYQNTALYPITDMLQRVLNWNQDDTPAAKLHALEQTLRAYRLELDEAVPLIADLLSLSIPEDRYLPLSLSQQEQRQRTLAMIVAMLLQQTEKQPILFIMEDLHWTDPSTLELLDLLIDQTPTAAICVLLTYRPDFQAPWSSRSYLTQMTLNRLSRSQIESMAERVAGGKRLPAEVVQQIVEKTDGVPLFVEEMTKAVVELGALKEVNGQYKLTGPFSSLTIPASLQDSLMARLDRLVTAKGVAQYAAVIGRQFSYALLHAVLQLNERTLQDELQRLVEAELVYQRGVPPQATYTFKHALIQDTAYQSLLKSARQQYHQRIAQVLASHFPEMIETQPELLAHHFTEAGMAEQAIDYWQQAGDYANRRYAHNEAIAHLRQGLAILETLPETTARIDREIRFYMAMRIPLLAAKGHSDSEVGRVFARVRELCQHGEDSALHTAALHGLRLFYSGHAQHRQAAEIAEESLHVAQRSQNPVLLIQQHYDMGVSLYTLGRLRPAIDHFSQSLTYTDSHQDLPVDPLQDTSLYSILSRAHTAFPLWMLGYPEQALQWCREALSRSQAHTNPNLIWTMQATLWAKQRALLLYAARCEWAILHEAAEDLVAIATTYNMQQVSALASTMLGWWRVVQAQDPDGITQLEENVQVLKDLGVVIFYPYRLAQLAEAYAHIGRLEDGLASVEEGFKVVNATEEYLYHAELHRLKGTLLLMSEANAYQKAETCFYQAINIARRQEAKSLELRAATSLARLWQQQNKRQDAFDLLSSVYEWFTEGFDTADLQEAKALLDELET